MHGIATSFHVIWGQSGVHREVMVDVGTRYLQELLNN